MTTWERLSVTTLGSSGDTIDSGTITNKQHLKFEIYAIADGSVNPGFRFNSDAGTNYTRRREHNGSSDGTNTSANELNSNGASTNTYVSGDIINIATKEKFLIAEYVVQKTGAGNAPDRMELTGKWANTSDAITSIQVYNSDNGSFDTGSTLTVWGADDQGTTAKDKSTITNVPVGTRYEETDTRKIFRKVATTGAVTYTGDMSSGWTTASGDANDFVIDTTNEEVDFLNSYNTPPDNVRWDSSTVATLSTTAWVVRFAYQNTGTAANDNPVWWVGFSTHSTVLSNSTAQDFIGFGTQVGNGGTNLYPYLYAADNARLDQATAAQRLQLDSSNVNLVSNNTKYYIEIKRDGNDFTVNAYSDSAYSTLLCTKTYTYSAIGTIRYFIIANYIQGDNVTGTFSEFNWWNGVTEIITEPWVEKGTA